MKAQVRHRWERKSCHNMSAKSERNYMLMLKQYQIIYPQVFKQSISIVHLKLEFNAKSEATKTGMPLFVCMCSGVCKLQSKHMVADN